MISEQDAFYISYCYDLIQSTVQSELQDSGNVAIACAKGPYDLLGDTLNRCEQK